MNIDEVWAEAERRLNVALNDIEESQTEQAITDTLIQIGVNTAPMIPIDEGNLINTEFREVKQSASGWEGKVGYGNGRYNYALYVHEASGKLAGQPRANGNDTYWSPNGEPKFLLKGATETVNTDLPSILRRKYER